jgi:hypothetical protein
LEDRYIIAPPVQHSGTEKTPWCRGEQNPFPTQKSEIWQRGRTGLTILITPRRLRQQLKEGVGKAIGRLQIQCETFVVGSSLLFLFVELLLVALRFSGSTG